MRDVAWLFLKMSKVAYENLHCVVCIPQVKNCSPGNMDQAPSRGHEASPQSRLAALRVALTSRHLLRSSQHTCQVFLLPPGRFDSVRRAGWVWAAGGSPAAKIFVR